MLYRGPSIRSFHDLQFDLRSLLHGIKDLEESGSVVTIKWANGAVDKVPTASFIRSFTGNTFPQLHVGPTESGATLTDDNGLSVSTPVSLKMDTFTGDSVRLTGCSIASLVADVITLATGTRISSLSSSGKLSATTATAMNGDLNVEEDFNIDVLKSNVLDTSSGTHSVVRQHVITQYIAMSSYVTMFTLGKFTPSLVVDGRMKTYTATNINRNYEYLYTDAPYIENGRAISISSGRNEVPEAEYPKGSLPDLALLYPYKLFTRNSNTIATLTYKAPEANMQNMVVNVRNVTPDTIRACNVWTFNQDSYAGERRVKVTPISYVDIPPLSAIDYIFTFDYSSDALYAYMLPTKVLT